MLRLFTLLITAFLCLQAGSQCLAQDVNKIIKKGIDELENKRDIIAYNYFLDALYIEPENKKAKLYAGICHLHLQSPQKALEYLLDVKDTEEANKLPDYNAYLATAYHLNKDFENAEKTINNIKDSISSENVDVQLIKNNISNAQLLCKEAMPYAVINMGSMINTQQHEYGTAAFSDHRTVLYTSRPDLWDKDTIQSKVTLYENVFLVDLDSNYSWNEPHYFTNPHLRGNDAVIQVFDNDTKLLTYHNGDLFISNKKEDHWEKGEPIKEINTPANESHGFITEDGNTLYFSSNFDTYDGNLNLYISKKENGTWSEPQPLVGLNTPYDEDSPFIGEDGYFYFSSKGHNSIGNYDIFRAKYDDEAQTWGEPENLGVPVNSVFDDLYYTNYGRMAYFSSLRPGGNGGMDLYRVLPFKEVKIAGKLKSEETGELLANSTENLNFGEQSFDVSTDNEGNYELNVPVAASNYFHIAQNEKQENIIFLHFGDSANGLRQIGISLSVFSEEIPEAKLDTTPDAKPDTEENNTEEKVTQDSVLVKNNTPIKDSLLVNNEKVINESNSIAENNNNEIKTNKTIENTEVEKTNENVSESVVETKTYTFTEGTTEEETDNIQPDVEEISLNREKDNSYTNNSTITRIREGKTANLFLYFDFNAAMINEVFYEGLDEIANYLKTDESILIEVGGHTDNVGSHSFNEQLSERRAKAVALYLIESGIDKSRVMAKGYGESMPIASNDDEAEGRELNRRVELKKITSAQLSSLGE